MPKHQAFGRFKRAAGRSAAFVFSPAVVIPFMLLGAIACCVYGTLLLWGNGWAFLAASACLFVVAAAISRGLIGG